jgi:hypothetical protein
LAKVKEAPADQVRALYRRHDEIESNPPSRDRFARSLPALDRLQARIVDDLETEGCSVTTVAELFSADTWEALRADATSFTTATEARFRVGGGTPEPRPHKAPKAGKPPKPAKEKFAMVRRYKSSPPDLTSPWLQFGASERMLAIVNSYLRMWSKLSYVDQWYTPPVGAAAHRVGSMRWHRDYNDQYLVKVFVYLVDVDEGTGPIEYVPGSVRGGPFADDWPWDPVGETYPPPDEFARRIPSAAARTFTGPAGSMIFCNTSGFHRGGFAADKPRSVFVFNYVSPAGLEALVDRNFDVSGSAATLPEVARFALA